MDQTCFGSRDFFWPMGNGGSSAPATASLYREPMIYADSAVWLSQ
jgi:hypothetical protein